MNAQDIASVTGGRVVSGNPARQLSGITYDSRKVESGFLFLALRGQTTDGHSYIPQALDNGASAVLLEDISAIPSGSNAAFIQVANSRKAAAAAASAYYGLPACSLKILAITGTNGKTSTSYLIQSILNETGTPTGVIGTLGARFGEKEWPLAHTTPEACDLQELLCLMRNDGAAAVALEASSHALAQNRFDGVFPDCCVFTNLTQDHLDFHGTMEDYFQAKALLFTRFIEESHKEAVSVVNLDDPWGKDRLAPLVKGRLLSYAIHQQADLKAVNLQPHPGGVKFEINYQADKMPVSLSLGGYFSVYNALAAAGACLAMGVSLKDVSRGLETVPSVPGRFELVDCGQPFAVVVDYAHTPDGLENVLASARAVTKGRLVSVFGCGGDRDRAKRPLMGEIAARLSNIAILTSDNPRSEDPEAIARDILAGIPHNRRQFVATELDRRKAILRACSEALEGDTVVIAGKGHEPYQIFRDKTIDFDDRVVVRQVLAGLVQKTEGGMAKLSPSP